MNRKSADKTWGYCLCNFRAYNNCTTKFYPEITISSNIHILAFTEYYCIDIGKMSLGCHSISYIFSEKISNQFRGCCLLMKSTYGNSSEVIRVPENLILKEENLTEWVYGSYFSEESIHHNWNVAIFYTKKSTVCYKWGNASIIGEERVYLRADSVENKHGNEDIQYLSKFLNSLSLKSMLPHSVTGWGLGAAKMPHSGCLNPASTPGSHPAFLHATFWC